MVIRQNGRIYSNTPETSPEWERFRPANDNECGEDVVRFKGMDGKWKYDGSVTPLEIVSIVLEACKEE